MPLPRPGVAAAAAAQPAPQNPPRHGPHGVRDHVRDVIQVAFMFAVVVLAFIVSSTLAVGGGLQVWRGLQALHAQGIKAVALAEVIALFTTVAGGVWLAVTLVWNHAQATQGVKELKPQQQGLKQELKQQQQGLKQKHQEFKQVHRLDLVLAYEKRLAAVEAVVYGRASTQQSNSKG